MVHREPVEIDKKGRPVAVVVSYANYQEMLEGLGEAATPADLSWLREWRKKPRLQPPQAKLMKRIITRISITNTANDPPVSGYQHYSRFDHQREGGSPERLGA